MVLDNSEKFEELLNTETRSNKQQRKGYLKLNFFIHPLSFRTVSNYISTNMYPESKAMGKDHKLPEIYKEQYLKYVKMRTSVLEDEASLLQNFHRERRNSQSVAKPSELKQFHNDEVLKGEGFDQKRVDDDFELENEKLEMEFKNMNQQPKTYKPERKTVEQKAETQEKVEMSYGLPETVYDELGLYNQKIHENELAESGCELDDNEGDEGDKIYYSKSLDETNKVEYRDNDTDEKDICIDYSAKTPAESKDKKKKKKKLLGKVKKIFGKGKKDKK